MPLRRCWNFEDNGSRKTWPNGSEKQCRPNCAFVHPSEPDWDRAPPAIAFGKGGPPQSGRGRGQSSFGPPATGANTSALGSERGNSGTWDDYMTGFSSNPRAASSARGASSRRSGQTTSGTTGWGSSGADGPGWGSSGADNPGWGSSGADGPGWGSSGADGPGWGSSGADGPGWGSSGADNPGWGSSGADNPGWGSSTDHNEKPSDGWSNVPDASGEKALSSQRDTQAAEWGSSGDGWGAVVTTDLGPDWGDTSISDQGKKASSATKVAVITDPDALSGGTGAVDNPDAATAATPWSPVTPSIPTSGEVNATHNKPRVEDTPAPAISLAIKSTKMRPLRGDYENHFFSTLSGTDKMGFLIAMTLKMRELDAELSQLSALRKSRQVMPTRAAKEFLQIELHKFIDTRAAVEAELNACSGKLTQPDLLCLSNVQHALATLGREYWRLEQSKDWVSRAETCLSQVQHESSPSSPNKRSNGVTFASKLNQLDGKSESLADTILQCQGQQFYNALLDDQIQDKKAPIMAAIVKGQDMTYNHFVLSSLFPLQRQGEAWHETLQIQAGKLAQALLQTDQLKNDKKNQASLEKGAIQQQLQVDITQKRLQLQDLQEEMTQLHHTLASIKQQQQTVMETDTLEAYASHIQEYVQGYIQANATLIIQAELSKAGVQFTAAELKTVEKVWKTLQPSTQMSIWLQHSDIHKTEEEMEIKEIEESLLA